MQRAVVCVLAVWLGCASEARVPPATRAKDAAVQTEPVVDAGRDAAQQAPFATTACDIARCEREAAELAQSLTTAAASALAVKGGECTRVDIVGVVAGMACTCQSTNGWLYIGPEGAGCFARGRAGDCLWDDAEFEACTAGDPACPAMCDELQKRYAADAARIFDVEVRSSTCLDDGCHHVLRIGEACYADRSFESGRRFDCALSDAEILERRQ